MTLRTFARRTGWPLAELLQLRWTDFNALLALYGLRCEVVLARGPRQRRFEYEEHIVERET